MMKRLEIEALQSQLASVRGLLSGRSEDEDPIGWFQFSQQAKSLEQELEAISDRFDPAASIAMYFGGRPVIGSRGIAADFSANIINGMQSLVAAQAASHHRELGGRGPIPQRDQSKMIVTDVARGSFGFIFEEANPSAKDADGESAVEEICTLLRVAADAKESFETVTEDFDQRVIQNLNSFFKTLRDAGASVRVATDTQDFSIAAQDVVRAIDRTEGVTINEHPTTATGRLFVIPDSRRFELNQTGGEPLIKGRVAAEWAKEMFDDDRIMTTNFLGNVVTVHLRVREASQRGRETQRSYTLLGLTGEASKPPEKKAD